MSELIQDIQVIANICEQANLQVEIDEDPENEKIEIKKDIRQVDKISQKLFNLILEKFFKNYHGKKNLLK